MGTAAALVLGELLAILLVLVFLLGEASPLMAVLRLALH